MIDKEKNKARYRLSHCVNVLFSFDHGTFRWWREDKSSGLFTKIQGQTDIDSRFGQMVSKIQDWQISSLNLVHHLQKSNPFSQKTATKACTGIKGDFDEMEHQFLLGTFGTEKHYLFRNSVAHRSFLIGMTWKVIFHLLANWIFRKLLAYGNELRSLPRDMFM